METFPALQSERIRFHHFLCYDSEPKKTAEALMRENEKIEEENSRKDKEIADLLKMIKNAKS